MVDKKKKIGYYASRGRCLRAYSLRKMNRRTKRKTVRKVNSSNKVLKKGTRIFKTKSACKRYISRRRRSPVHKRRRRSPVHRRRRSSVHRRRRSSVHRRSRFGKGCGTYTVPWFGQEGLNGTPRIAHSWSGTPDTGISNIGWAWPNPPGALAYDLQQGGWY